MFSSKPWCRLIVSDFLLERLAELKRVVGNTPVLRLRRLFTGDVEVYMKLEFVNPTGSHKDRIAVFMIEDAIRKGLLGPGGTVIEASSGNTAVSVAWVAARLGLRAVIVVEEQVSRQKVGMLKSLGAEIVYAKQGENVKLASELAEKLGGVWLNQYGNLANHMAHYTTTGPEILRQLGEIDLFVMGMGTCGTVTGVGRFLKEKLGNRVKVVGVVPRGSAIKGGPGKGDRIEGLITSFVPGLCREFGEYVDEIIEVSYDEALEAVRELARNEGILAGLSSGANIVGVRKALELFKARKVVTIAADSMLRYPELFS